MSIRSNGSRCSIGSLRSSSACRMSTGNAMKSFCANSSAMSAPLGSVNFPIEILIQISHAEAALNRTSDACFNIRRVSGPSLVSLACHQSQTWVSSNSRQAEYSAAGDSRTEDRFFGLRTAAFIQRHLRTRRATPTVKAHQSLPRFLSFPPSARAHVLHAPLAAERGGPPACPLSRRPPRSDAGSSVTSRTPLLFVYQQNHGHPGGLSGRPLSIVARNRPR